jgi:hypothetical protein
MGLIRPVAGSPPTMPGVPGFDAASSESQAGILGKAQQGGVLDSLGSAAASGNRFLASGDVLKADSNPYLRDAVDAAVRPITENFQRSVMPSVRGGAVASGALGSSKAGQARDNAADMYMRAIGETSSGLLNTAYGQGLEAMTKGIALTPQTQSATLFPEIAQDSVGQARRTLQMQQGQRDFDNAMFPFQMGLQLLGSAAATPGGGTSGTVTGASPSASPLQQALGAGLSMLAFL